MRNLVRRLNRRFAGQVKIVKVRGGPHLLVSPSGTVISTVMPETLELVAGARLMWKDHGMLNHGMTIL